MSITTGKDIRMAGRRWNPALRSNYLHSGYLRCDDFNETLPEGPVKRRSLQGIGEGAGKQFHPELVKAFLRAMNMGDNRRFVLSDESDMTKDSQKRVILSLECFSFCSFLPAAG